MHALSKENLPLRQARNLLKSRMSVWWSEVLRARTGTQNNTSSSDAPAPRLPRLTSAGDFKSHTETIEQNTYQQGS